MDVWNGTAQPLPNAAETDSTEGVENIFTVSGHPDPTRSSNTSFDEMVSSHWLYKVTIPHLIIYIFEINDPK